MVSNYTLSDIALKIESCLVIMEEIPWKQEVFTLNANSASNSTGKLFYPVLLTCALESDVLTAHRPVTIPPPQPGNPKDCRGSAVSPQFTAEWRGEKDIKSSSKTGKAFTESSAPNNVGHQLLRLS